MNNIPSFSHIIRLSFPVVLANMILPLQGFIDIAIMGHLNNVNYISGLGFITQLFSIMLVSFNFLQYTTSGVSAQAAGQSNLSKLINIYIRSSIIVLLISMLLLPLSPAIFNITSTFFSTSDDIKYIMKQYFNIRIWGLPAELFLFVCTGWFAGQTKTNNIMLQQLILITSNITISLFLVFIFNLDIKGVALGTTIASYIAATYSFYSIKKKIKLLSNKYLIINWKKILDISEFRNIFFINRDMFIRTVILTFSFAWILRLSGQQDSITLSSNIILFQIITFCSFALDGVAIVTEGLCGKAYGQNNQILFKKIVKKTIITSAATSILLMLTIITLLPFYISLMTDIKSVQNRAYLDFHWCYYIPIIGFLAYQLDGVFTGATASTEIRKTMIYTAIIFFPASYFLELVLDNNGIWFSIYLLLILRAVGLIYFLPKITDKLWLKY